MPPSRSSRTVSARPSAGPPSSSSRPVAGRGRASRPAPNAHDLPIWEAPIASLTRSAQHQLSTLPIKHDLSSLQSRLADAHERLASAAADMHEMKTMRVDMAAVRAEKRREKGQEAAEPADTARLQELVQRVDAMTERIERAVRRTVDREARMGEAEDALRELSANHSSAPPRRGAPGATQSTPGLTQTQMTADPAEDDEPEPPAPTSVVEALQTKLKDAEAKYDALSMRERYSAHNSYVAFRKMLHSAQYSDDAAAPPVPHASAWFDEARGEARHLKPSSDGTDADTHANANANESPEHDGLAPPSPTGAPSLRPPNTQGADADGAEASDDASDIEAVAERTSIRCPLTLQPMVQPVSSTKCPHSFERAAILEYLGSSSTGSTRAGTRAPRAASCPVCEVLLTAADLQVDRVLQRRIRRIQEAEARRDEADEDDEDEEDDEGEGRKRGGKSRAELIASSSPLRSGAAPPSGTARSSAAARVKAERMSGVRRG